MYTCAFCVLSVVTTIRYDEDDDANDDEELARLHMHNTWKVPTYIMTMVIKTMEHFFSAINENERKVREAVKKRQVRQGESTLMVRKAVAQRNLWQEAATSNARVLTVACSRSFYVHFKSQYFQPMFVWSLTFCCRIHRHVIYV